MRPARARAAGCRGGAGSGPPSASRSSTTSAGQGRPADRVAVARVGDQRGMGERASGHGPRRRRSGTGAEVRRQAPARVERRAEAGDRHAPQQRLEPQERGQRPDLVGDVDQRGAASTRAAPRRRGAASVCRRGTAPGRRPGLHVGVRLVERSPRPGSGRRARLPAGRGWCAPRPAAEPDRRVVLDLPGHEDAPALGQGGQGPGAEVVFRDPRARPAARPGVRRAAAAAAGWRPRRSAARAGFRGRVVVDAEIVGDEREGRHQVRAEPARAQEPVLHAP